MKVLQLAVMAAISLLVLSGCNDSVTHPDDDHLVAIAQKINDAIEAGDGNDPFADQNFQSLTPIEKGRVMDIATELLGFSVERDDSAEALQHVAMEHFGVGMENLDEQQQRFVQRFVSNSSTPQTRRASHSCRFVSYNQRVKYKKKKKKYKKKKKHYPIAVERVVNDPRERLCDFEIVFAKSGRDYIYADSWIARRILKKASKKNHGYLAARDHKRRVIVGWWTAKRKSFWASDKWITHRLMRSYLWKK